MIWNSLILYESNFFLQIIFESKALCNSHITAYNTRSHHRYFWRPGTTGGGRQTTENGRHFKAFCEKHGRTPLENSWLMQVPRYRTAYTPFASLLLWSIWICHCVKLALFSLSLSLFLSPRLSCSRSSHSVSQFLSIPFSLAVVLRSLFKVSVHLSVRPPSPLSPSFPLRKFATLHGEEQKSISRGENWVTETIKKDAGWSAYTILHIHRSWSLL